MRAQSPPSLSLIQRYGNGIPFVPSLPGAAPFWQKTTRAENATLPPVWSFATLHYRVVLTGGMHPVRCITDKRYRTIISLHPVRPMKNTLIAILAALVVILIALLAYYMGKAAAIREPESPPAQPTSPPPPSDATKKAAEETSPPATPQEDTAQGTTSEEEEGGGQGNGGTGPEGPSGGVAPVGGIKNPEKPKSPGIGGITAPEPETEPPSIGTIGATKVGALGDACTANDDCASGLFCKKTGADACAASTEGVCKKRPEGYFPCPLSYEPVCACNGQTYANECYAARAGMSIAYQGKCQ